jgi:Zinc dependent phospholipase C
VCIYWLFVIVSLRPQASFPVDSSFLMMLDQGPSSLKAHLPHRFVRGYQEEANMPGAYAHLTLVNVLGSPQYLDQMDMPDAAKEAILDYKKFVELGATSPDLPYLKLNDDMFPDEKATEWADHMHYLMPGEMIKAIARKVRQEADPDRREKQLAWLFGYTSHVGGDTTIHPVVELKVGPYAENKQHHRVCEVHQDAYIFQRLDVGRAGLGDYLASGISNCTDEDRNLDGAIASLWEAALEERYPKQFASNPPAIQDWYKGFQSGVENAGRMSRLMPLARHVCVGCGVSYPTPEEVDQQYIKNLKTPRGVPMDYDAIFDLALKNVGGLWIAVADYVFHGNGASLDKIPNLNLDTGRDLTTNVIRMWE